MTKLKTVETVVAVHTHTHTDNSLNKKKILIFDG